MTESRHIFRRLSAGIRHRMTGSLANRVALVVLVWAIVLLALVGGSSYLAMRSSREQVVKAELAGEIGILAQKLENRLNELVRTLDGAADSSFVANGLTDSEGRSAYLVPFLRDYMARLPEVRRLTLVDFQGREIADGQGVMSRPSRASSADIGRCLAGKGRCSTLVSHGNEAFMEVVQPVYFAPTATVEGGLVARVSLRDLFKPIALSLSPAVSLRLRGAQGRLLTSNQQELGPEYHLEARALNLDPPLDQLQLVIELGLDPGMLYTPFRRLWLVYGSVGALLLVLSAWGARLLGRRFAEPIVLLSQTAAAIAEGGSEGIRRVPERSDEVGILARAFTRMVVKLQESNETLEARVRERTEDLHASRQLLANIVDNVPLAIGVCETSREDAWVLWNRTAERIFGYGVEEIGQNLSGGSLLPIALPLDDELSGEQDHWEMTSEYTDPRDGRKRILYSRVLGLFNEQGQLSHLVTISDDVTERKRSENLILNIARGVSAQTGEHFFRALVECLAHCCLIN